MNAAAVVSMLDAHAAKPASPQESDGNRRPMNWDELQGKEPPVRDWIVPHWIPAEHVTLLAGRAGIGKTLLAQHLASAIALGARYIEPLQSRRVLMWAGEDDEAELWRRQVHISSFLQQPLSALTERFYLHSYAGLDMTLAAPAFGELQTTALMSVLRAQVNDYKPGLVIIDNAARVFGGSENDRHAVTTFLAWLQGACRPAAVLLLAHPGKAQGSEFSGSTAWEGAVRARLYMSDRLPDAGTDDEDQLADERFRYLSRRKANYSALDLRRFSLIDGTLVPETAAAITASALSPSGEPAKDIVRRVVRRLAERDIHGTRSTSSPNYLPKLASQYGLLENATPKVFKAAMHAMLLAGELATSEVGKYPNRSPKLGLTLKGE